MQPDKIEWVVKADWISVGPFATMAGLNNDDSFPVEAARLSGMAHRLPGVWQRVDYPCGCKKEGAVYTAIVHLNDHHQYTREQIADWLDEEVSKGNINIDFLEETT